jgi:hypothetical protein
LEEEDQIPIKEKEGSKEGRKDWVIILSPL